MFQEKLIILYMREKQMFISSVVSIQWWKQYYRKKNYLVVHQPGGEGRGREGRWGEGVTTDLPAKWVTWRLLPQAKWVNYLLKSLELHKHANLFMKSKRQDSSPACLRLLRAGSPLFPLPKMLNQQEMHETVLWPRNKISDWKVVYEGLVIITPSIVPPHLMLHF